MHQVAQAAADQAEVVLREPEHEQRGVPHVVNRVLERQLGGHRCPGPRRGHLVVRDRQDPLEARRRVEAHGRLAGPGADHEAAVKRGGHVVRVPLELGGELEQWGVELVHMVGSRQSRDDRCGARPKARRRRYLGADLEGHAVGRV